MEPQSNLKPSDQHHDERPRLIAYIVGDTKGYAIEPASYQRDWMDETPNRFAYRCLPLVIANQAGWVIRCPVTFSAEWNGETSHDGSIRFEFVDSEIDNPQKLISSHFGSGIITFSIPWLFRTSTNTGLLARGLPNSPKPNATPLEGFVETDWSAFTFTMNWMINKPKEPVQFQEGEPFCFLQPMNVTLVEQTEPMFRSIEEDPIFMEEYHRWRISRSSFNADPERGTSWQKNYFQGKNTLGQRSREHRTKLEVHEFADMRNEFQPGSR